jgi:hypothetical protein
MSASRWFQPRWIVEINPMSLGYWTEVTRRWTKWGAKRVERRFWRRRFDLVATRVRKAKP